jgi:hypothetical protein
MAASANRGERAEAPSTASNPTPSAAVPPSGAPELASAAPVAPRPGTPPRIVPQGMVPGAGQWVEEFRIQPLADDTGKTVLDAQVKCAEAGLSLCTESQWARACAEDANTGREASWTLTGHASGFVVRGGGNCQIRAVVPGSSATTDRHGTCCERSVAVGSTNSNKNFLVATAAKLEEVEAALNSRKSSRVVGLMGEGVNIDGEAKTLAQVTKLFDDSYQKYPDQWSVIDNCNVSMQTIVRRVPVVTKSKRGVIRRRMRRLESSSWSAECDVLQQRGGEVSLVTLGYVFGGNGKIQSIDEEQRSREWSKP